MKRNQIKYNKLDRKEVCLKQSSNNKLMLRWKENLMMRDKDQDTKSMSLLNSDKL